MQKISCKQTNLPPSITGHIHSHAHLVLPFSESVYLQYGETEVVLQPGYMAFVPPSCFHRYFSQKDQGTIVMDIPEQMIKASDLSSLSGNSVLMISAALRPLIELIRYDMGENPESDSVRYLFYYLYDKLVESHRIRSLQYISDNFAENLSVAQLAAIENYNPSYYSDWFKKQTGYLPSEYIQNVRIEKSKALLVNTHYKVIEIAMQVGYCNSSAFTRAFHKSAGVSPREFRARFSV